MQQQIVVLGAGMVGRVIAMDLAKEFQVTSVDRSRENLSLFPPHFDITTLVANLSDTAAVSKAIRKADLVIGAVPGFMGYKTLEAVLKAGKPIVDISFFPEDALLLDSLAKKHRVTAIVDCGVAPGMDNMILGYHAARMPVSRFTCYVGGLPVTRTLPFQYKAPFSPIDVIEEYTRPARLVEEGKVVTRPALSEPELLEFEGIGTLEAFNTDGLRSLTRTMKIPFMKEKTLRYPGHRLLMQNLKDAGLFDTQPVKVAGKMVTPLELTAAVLLPQWKLQPQEPEFTVMRVEVSGKEKSKTKTYRYDLFDRNDPETGFSSMSRTTSFTATGAARLLLNGLYDRPGVNPPEFVGADPACFEFMMQHLRERGVNYFRSEW